ncbi:MAG TPA: lysophospholipid acyltransferase family protein [Candidatus Omnitrophota bacterium]|nr:lysophospholipid acyltransferase family protein [Candidatus Omnitrophota bacterium]
MRLEKEILGRKRKFRLNRILPFWDRMEYEAVRGTVAFLNFLPLAVATWLARRAGEIGYWLSPKRRRIILCNLDIAFGNSKSETEKKRLAIESMRHLVTTVVEFTRIPKISKKIDRHIRVEGSANLAKAYVQKKGIVFLTSHVGTWEYQEFLAYFLQTKGSVITKKLRNPYLDRWMCELRKMTRVSPIDKDNAIKPLLKAIRNNESVAILIDQWAGPDELWIPFFGKETSATSLPARMARKTGCILLPIYCFREAPGKYVITVGEEIPLSDDPKHWEEITMRNVNRFFEDVIRAHPEQWLWAHLRWRDKK